MYGPEWRSSLELGRTRAQCPSPTIKRSGLTGIIIEETHDPAGCTRRGVAVYTLIMLMLACTDGYEDPRGRIRCYVQKITGKPMQRPALDVISRSMGGGKWPFDACGRWSGGAHPES